MAKMHECKCSRRNFIKQTSGLAAVAAMLAGTKVAKAGKGPIQRPCGGVICPFCLFENEPGALICEQCKSDLS